MIGWTGCTFGATLGELTLLFLLAETLAWESSSSRLDPDFLEVPKPFSIFSLVFGVSSKLVIDNCGRGFFCFLFVVVADLGVTEEF